MTAASDKDIVSGCLDPANYGCGKRALTIALVGLAGVAAALTVAGHVAMGLV